MKSACAILILLVSAQIFAAEDTTFLGPSGLIYTPSARILDKKSFNLGMWYDRDDLGRSVLSTASAMA